MFMLQRYTFSMIKTSKLHTFSMITNVKCKRLRVYTLHNSKKAVTAD